MLCLNQSINALSGDYKSLKKKIKNTTDYEWRNGNIFFILSLFPELVKARRSSDQQRPEIYFGWKWNFFNKLKLRNRFSFQR